MVGWAFPLSASLKLPCIMKYLVSFSALLLSCTAIGQVPINSAHDTSYSLSATAAGISPIVPATYKAAAVSGNDTSYAHIDLLHTSATAGSDTPHISSITSTNPTICGLCDGTVVLHGIRPHEADTIFYSLAGVLQPLKAGSAGTDSTITITGLCAGAYDYFYVKVGESRSNQPPATLVNPPVTASFTVSTHLGCNGDTVVFANTSTPEGYTSSWAFGDGGTSATYSPTHVYADQPTYTGTYTATLTYYTSPGCAAAYTVTNTFHHPVAASFAVDVAIMCLGLPDSFRNNSAGGIVSSRWNFGNGDSTVAPGTSTIGYTYPFGGLYTPTLTVTDTVGCQKSAATNLTVISIDVHTAIHDTAVCLADSLLLPTTVMVAPGTVDSISYEWVSASGAPGTHLSDPYCAAPLFMGTGTYTHYFIATTHPLHCNASDSVTIHSYPPATLANVTPSPQTITYGSSIQLNADSAVFYNWVPDNGTLNDPNISDPVATPTDSVTVYTVYGMTAVSTLRK